MFIVHCDGAAAPSNPGPSAAGVMVHENDLNNLTCEFGAFLQHGTNQTAELSAAILGLRATPEGSEILLVSDSQYVLKGLTEWRRAWEFKKWRNSQGKPVANKSLWVALFAEYDLRKVTCQWVRGHDGNVYNERCDFLAAQAISRDMDSYRRHQEVHPIQLKPKYYIEQHGKYDHGFLQKQTLEAGLEGDKQECDSSISI